MSAPPPRIFPPPLRCDRRPDHGHIPTSPSPTADSYRPRSPPRSIPVFGSSRPILATMVRKERSEGRVGHRQPRSVRISILARERPTSLNLSRVSRCRSAPTSRDSPSEPDRARSRESPPEGSAVSSPRRQGLGNADAKPQPRLEKISGWMDKFLLHSAIGSCAHLISSPHPLSTGCAIPTQTPGTEPP